MDWILNMGLALALGAWVVAIWIRARRERQRIAWYAAMMRPYMESKAQESQSFGLETLE